MVYRFTIISDEVDNFLREIQIDPEATFLDFHKAILEAVGFKEGELASFFVCDDEWNKDIEVTLEEMDTDSATDSYIMSKTRIGKLVDEALKGLEKCRKTTRSHRKAAQDAAATSDKRRKENWPEEMIETI